MSSFGAVTFTAVEDGWSEVANSAVNVRGFPGGDNWAISLAGQREITRTITCVFPDRGSYVNLVLLRGTQNTLDIEGWDTVTAVLKSTSVDVLPRGDGQMSCKAEFVLSA